MDVAAFEQSLSHPIPPAGISVYLESLWYDGAGNWEKAHELIQDVDDSHAALIHAYLHRKEGDQGNADYWYRRAGRRTTSPGLPAEWKELVLECLQLNK